MVVPATRAGNWMNRHQSFLDRARQGGIDLLFLGDSITDGWRDTGLETWTRCFEPLAAANFGLWGDATANLLWRVQNGELEGFAPKLIVLLIGTNDIPWEVTAGQADPSREAAFEAISRVVQTLRSRQPASRILILGVFPREEKPCLAREVLRALNAQLSGLADGNFVHFLDIGHIFMEGDRIPSSIMPDELHLSAEAYRRWGEALLPVVQQLL